MDSVFLGGNNKKEKAWDPHMWFKRVDNIINIMRWHDLCLMSKNQLVRLVATLSALSSKVQNVCCLDMGFARISGLFNDRS